uniref:30S ribosomal protein S6 n=1 Tax=Cryptomonas curvata TaxID=233186 RepID=A0A7S0MJW4_9CRYP|mmetsp:Transcript_44944/g.94145  ORF Transcript_44944/g.94145 Transcript_44944/m.94145 type:complete len:160 (+) Transcript_44944:228-707(+)|eukprot:CAMPEP_0172191720 /NCGR_PEP_ID=MMETSP1050-20130122/23884_1 /TAXON_ID=233186 /ORGANISM="Cryptomonas curvata, Strain CCAP979/52" /LENGTH=159 /DNA_ID=CAMNT_0012866853 /DNA_START=225 /DNA_END=704 /DNA_ORIENTATION=-
MPLYQLTVIARAGSSAADIHALLSKLNQLVLDQSGVVAGVSNWGVQKLAYRMKAHQEFHTQGRFMQLKFVVSPAVLKELERNMKLDERVLRFMTIKERNTSFMTVGGYDPDHLNTSVQKLISARLQDGAIPSDYFNYGSDAGYADLGFNGDKNPPAPNP